jgi:hypothetical protein
MQNITKNWALVPRIQTQELQQGARAHWTRWSCWCETGLVSWRARTASWCGLSGKNRYEGVPPKMLFPCHQKTGQNDTEIANRSFENVSQFKYLETTVTNQNFIQKEI